MDSFDSGACSDTSNTLAIAVYNDTLICSDTPANIYLGLADEIIGSNVAFKYGYDGATGQDAAGQYIFTVPNGVSLITIEVKGADGGNRAGNSRIGGAGATVTGSFNVIPNQQLLLEVGEVGENYAGGGGSGVATNTSLPVTREDLLLVAGAGGGAGTSSNGLGGSGVIDGGNGGGSRFGNGGINGGGGSQGANFEGVGFEKGGAGGGGFGGGIGGTKPQSIDPIASGSDDGTGGGLPSGGGQAGFGAIGATGGNGVGSGGVGFEDRFRNGSVSYTHLTLPTICSV